MQVIQRLYTSQATQCIQHAGYKGYKPIVSNTIYAYRATDYNKLRVTRQLQVTQYIMHTGYKGYKPIASNTMYYACWLCTRVAATCKQHNM